MRIADFALERYFARWEFAVEHLLCASDVEGWSLADLLATADPETRTLWDGLRLGYTDTLGHPLLRTQIAGLYENASADDVLVVAGPQEAIFLLSHALLEPGDHAVVAWPAYQSLHEVARSLGADVTLVELREADGWRLDPDEIRRALRPETRVVVVNAPHNPTGMLPSHAEWRAVAGLCADAGVHLLSDEVYRYLEADPADRLAAGCDALDRGVSIGGMSKSFAMAGLRIGWIATRDRGLLDRCARLKDYTTICASAPSEVLALMGLRARGAVIERSRAIVAENRTLFEWFVEGSEGRFAWVRPRGGSIAFPRLVADESIDAFAAALLEEEGVLLVPGSVFGHPGNHFRVGFGRAGFVAGLERLAAFAERRYG
ncbi:MAG: aminotransferase class I/II-fold pyridoxal phosphate-dependent enzyme [Chloroflexi bacterium]|jgi:aspartate/methionine/tyrosine aminotransferase|nr:aminotransferase class I/II-fold pyridoxal phosphate-dependent enzyme [Chloroflexota bacterium]